MESDPECQLTYRTVSDLVMTNDDGKRLDAAKRKAQDAVRELAAIYDEWSADAYDDSLGSTGSYFRDRAREVRECIDRIDG